MQPLAIESAAQALEQRAQSYNRGGDPDDNFVASAKLWTAWLEARGLLTGAKLTGFDVAMMIDLQKTARIATGGPHYDSFVDKIGYTEIARHLTRVTP